MTTTTPTTPMRRGYVDTPRGQLHYRSAGSGEKVVVLLHQTAASGAMYEAFVDTMLSGDDSDDYRFIAFDTPGFGNSFVPAEHYDIGDFARDFSAGLDALGVGKYHVLGHHTGVAMAVRLGATEPDRVLSVTMFGPLGLTAADNAEHYEGIHPIVLEQLGTHMTDVWMVSGGIDRDLAYPPDLPLLHREVVDKLHAGIRYHEAYESVFTTDIGADMARVTAPLLLLSALGDPLHRYLDQTLATNSAMLYRELEAGVYVFDQDPALVARAIADAGVWA